MLRWVGGSKRINVTALDGNYQLLAKELLPDRGRFALPILRVIIWLMRRSRLLRQVGRSISKSVYTAHL